MKNNNLLSEMADMFSLMERMDKHMTSDEAVYSKFKLLNEAVTGSGKGIYPISQMVKTSDKAKGIEEVKILIKPILTETAKKIKQTPPYSTLSTIDFTPTAAGTTDLKIRLKLPYGYINKVSKGNATSADPQAGATPQAGADTTPQAGAPAKKGLKAMVMGKNKPLEEGLLSKVKGGNAGATPQPQAGATPQPKQSETDKFKKWLNEFYLGIIKFMAQDPRYDQVAVQKLADVDFIYTKIMASVAEEDESYVAKDEEIVNNEILKIIRTGDYGKFTSVIGKIDIKAIVYGWTPAFTNAVRLRNKIAEYGLQKGDPEYPTLVYAPGVWVKRFNRRVVANPKHRYPMVFTQADQLRNSDKGTKAHRDSFKGVIGGYSGGFYAYDITDTEPLDPTNPVDYINSIPGLKNNVDYILNDLADAEQNANNQQQQAQMTPQQQQAQQLAKDEKGQSILCNTVLKEIASKQGIPLPDNSNSTNPIAVYVSNLLTYAKRNVLKAGNKHNNVVEPISYIIAFAIACYTVGADLLKSMNLGMLGGASLESAWKDKYQANCAVIVDTCNEIKELLITHYGKYNFDANGNGHQQGQQTSQQPQPQTAAKLEESIINNLTYLLENF